MLKLWYLDMVAQKRLRTCILDILNNALNRSNNRLYFTSARTHISELPSNASTMVGIEENHLGRTISPLLSGQKKEYKQRKICIAYTNKEKPLKYCQQIFKFLALSTD